MGSVASGNRYASGHVLHAQRRPRRGHRPLPGCHDRETRVRTSLPSLGRGAGEKGVEEAGHQIVHALSGFVPTRGRQRENPEEDRQALPGRTKRKTSAGQLIENTAGAVEIGESLFFATKFTRMGNEAAAGAAGRVFYVEHFVIEDVLDGDSGDGWMIHSAVQKDLIGSRVVTAELAAPISRTPADVGPIQTTGKIFFV